MVHYRYHEERRPRRIHSHEVPAVNTNSSTRRTNHLANLHIDYVQIDHLQIDHLHIDPPDHLVKLQIDHLDHLSIDRLQIDHLDHLDPSLPV